MLYKDFYAGTAEEKAMIKTKSFKYDTERDPEIAEKVCSMPGWGEFSDYVRALIKKDCQSGSEKTNQGTAGRAELEGELEELRGDMRLLIGLIKQWNISPGTTLPGTIPADGFGDPPPVQILPDNGLIEIVEAMEEVAATPAGVVPKTDRQQLRDKLKARFKLEG